MPHFPSGSKFKRVEPAGAVWLDIQRQIGAVRNEHWDPIGVADSVADEYDIYIAGLYAMLKQGESSDTQMDNSNKFAVWHS